LQVFEKIERDSAGHFIGRLDWVPVWLAAGIAVYFGMNHEPSAYAPWALLPLMGCMYLTRGIPKWCFIFTVWFLMLLGLSAAQWQTARMDAPKLPPGLDVVKITGTLKKVTYDEKQYKLWLENLTIAELPPEQTPAMIRVTFRGKEVPPIGSHVTSRGKIFAASGPAMPDDYDFGRYFFFRQIGAVGVIFPPLKPVDDAAELPRESSISEWVSSIRAGVQQRMLSLQEGEAITVLSALVTGDKSPIPKETAEAFRNSGLAHMLAISGMHMAIISGVFFLFLRSLLVLIPPISNRYNVKKIAAMMALIASSAYLVMADFPISAVRAYIMIAFMFTAVLLDREAVTVRSLMIAATVILLIYPSSLVEAGFQLSFSATLALVVSYRTFRMVQGTPDEQHSWVRRILLYLLGIIISSLIASLATLPFIMFHFQQINPYSIISNLAAVPFFGFIVMPMLMLAILLMPLGLEALPLKVAVWGMDYLIIIAQSVADIPGADFHVMPLANWSIVLIGAGMLLLLLHRLLWVKWAGFALITIGICTPLLYVKPDILVANDGRYIAVAEGESYTLIHGKSNRGFSVKQWKERLATEIQKVKKPEEAIAGASCDKVGCVLKKGDYTLAFPKKIEAVAEDCTMADYVFYESAVSKGVCKDANKLVDAKRLRDRGSMALWFGHDGRMITKFACDYTGVRPWTTCR